MIGEKVTAEKRHDGSVVLTIPEGEFIDIESAFWDGEVCCRVLSKNRSLDEKYAGLALQAAECLELLRDLLGRADVSNPLPRHSQLVN